MDAERWRLLDELFQEAVDLPPRERGAFLGERCRDDADLRREVEAMLAADDAESGAADPGASDDPASAPSAAKDRLAAIVLSGVDDAMAEDDDARAAAEAGLLPLPFPAVGPYRLIEELGRGGLATVYLGERDDEQFSMQVAIKLVRRGFDSPELLERLRLERQILASLEHPNIARLVDGGTAPDGRPYFVMERIEGERIDLWCERRGLDLRGRLKLFGQVCEAVQAAHRRLVLHRDLKPSNILVTEEGVPKLLDFGIAKLLDQAEGADAVAAQGFTTLTDTGMRLLTPEFASPEQVRGEALTTASDVYSLGVLLYLLVTGERPYTFERARPAEIERVVCEVEPRRPSAVVWDRAAGDEEGPTRSSLGWPRSSGGDDLDKILWQVLRKEPERRYGTVASLASDLECYLADLPISARPDTLRYRTGKFVRRHRVPVTAAVLMVLMLVAGVVATTWQAPVARAAQLRAEEQRQVAEEQRIAAELQRRRAEEAANFMVELFDVSDPFRAEGERRLIDARELIGRGAESLERRLGDAPLLRATLMTTIGRVYRNLALLDESEEQLVEALDLRVGELGESADEVLDGRNELAHLRLDQERYQEAEEILEQLKEARRSRGDSERLALTLEHLAIAQRALGRPAEAEALLTEALGLRADSGDALAAARIRTILGQILRQQGDSAGAEGLARRALEVQRRELGDEHPQVFLTQTDLALALQDSGRLEEAEEIFVSVLENHRRVFGERNHFEISSIHNLAILLTYRRQTDRALELFALNEERVRELYGENHPAMARVYSFRAQAYQVAGEPDQAIPWARRALDLNTEHLGPEHNVSLRDANQLAGLMVATGDPGAEEVLIGLVAAMGQVFGAEDYRLAFPLIQLGLLRLGQLEDPAAAEPSLRSALEVRRRSMPEGSWQIAEAVGHLGRCLMRLGRLEEAETLLESSSRVVRDVFEADHPMVETFARALEELRNARAGEGAERPEAARSARLVSR
ncbi:MAG: serine/threonine-protein kinase [Acidobacteriota bacterium]